MILPGKAPTILFLPGFRSSMTGIKASHLETACRARGRAFVRFDYRGHGASEGRLEDLVVGDWLSDTLQVLDRHVEESCLLVGSSMGGWLALLAAVARPQLVRGLVLVAPAPDFPERLILPSLSPSAKARLERDGRLELASAYGLPLLVTKSLVEESTAHRVLGRVLPLTCPIHILHGRLDRDVPWQLSMELLPSLARAPVTVEIVEDGDHRLSRMSDLRRLDLTVEKVLKIVAGRA